jgi:hypothetical protein
LCSSNSIVNKIYVIATIHLIIRVSLVYMHLLYVSPMKCASGINYILIFSITGYLHFVLFRYSKQNKTFHNVIQYPKCCVLFKVLDEGKVQKLSITNCNVLPLEPFKD